MWCTRIISWMSNTQKARHTRIWVTNRPWQLLQMINLFIIDTIFCGHIGYICIYLAILCSRYDPCAPHIQRGASNSKNSSRYDNFSENRDFGWKIYSLMVSTSLRQAACVDQKSIQTHDNINPGQMVPWESIFEVHRYQSHDLRVEKDCLRPILSPNFIIFSISPWFWTPRSWNRDL